MKSRNNGGNRTILAHLLSPNEETSSLTIGLYLIELLVKCVLWEFPKTLAFAKTIGCSLLIDGKIQLLKTKMSSLQDMLVSQCHKICCSNQLTSALT